MRVKLYKLDNYRMCTADKPFSIGINMNQCVKCPQDKPLFNLGTRECEKCVTGVN